MFATNEIDWSANEICFPRSFKDLFGDEVLECPAHERTPAPRFNDLSSRNAKEELNKIAIEIWIAIFKPLLAAEEPSRQSF
jgi:hypothetical protein